MGVRKERKIKLIWKWPFGILEQTRYDKAFQCLPSLMEARAAMKSHYP